MASLFTLALHRACIFANYLDHTQLYKSIENMKKLLFLLPIGLLFAACSNDFDVTAPWKEVPVVYGILSPQDSAHYIRIEKAFVDPDKSSLEIAQIVDSLYYPEDAIAVFLERADNQSRVQLHRVDGALEGYPRESGVFAGTPNWLYKVSGGLALESGKTYRLVIERKDGNPDITAQTTLPGNFDVKSPDLTSQVVKISFAGNKNTAIRWFTDVNGVFFNITFKIRVNERNLNGSLVSTQEFVWEAAKNIERKEVLVGGSFYEASVNILGYSFYNFLAQHLQRPAPNRYRELASCDLIIDGGGREIKEYLEVVEANGNITGAETFPNYSNISEGFGIFTAKSRTVVENIRFNTLTIDSMNLSSITDTLGFIY